MSSSIGNMQITKNALSRVSKRLLEQRVFKRELLAVEGDLVVTNEGIASAFGPNSYAFQNGLEFEEGETISIVFKGTVNSTEEECAWSLGDFSLTFKKDQITLYNLSSPICAIPNVVISSGDNIYIKTEITETTCYVYATVGSQVYQKVSVVSNVLPSNTNVTIGCNLLTGKYWHGDVSLSDFRVLRNEQIYWTPSVSNYMRLFKVLVSDGAFPLTDTSGEVLNHVSECIINEIQNTGNNIVVKCTLGAGVHQNIQEVGLYAETKEGTMLFALSTNLGVRKSSDLEYELIIFIDINLNVVNTVALPEIDVHKKEYISQEDFETIEKVHSYITPNLERMIKTNALGIGEKEPEFMPYSESHITEAKPVGVGYDEAQVLYRFQKDISYWEEGFSAVQGSSKLRHRFTPSALYSFDPSRIEKVGAVYVDNNGMASDFNNSAYVKLKKDIFSTKNPWEVQISFIPSALGDEESAILSFASNELKSSLLLGIRNKRCFIELRNLDYIVVETFEGLNTYERYEHLPDRVSWKVIGRDKEVKTVYTERSVPLDNEPVYSEEGYEVGKVVDKACNNEALNKDLFPIANNRRYFVHVSFDGDSYSVEYSLDNIGYKKVLRHINNRRVNTFDEVLIGVRRDEGVTSNHFMGDIFLSDYKIITKELNSLGLVIYETEASLMKKETYTKNILDYFHIPFYAHSFFKVRNLIDSSDSSLLEIFEGSINGEKDNINFNNPLGFSLCAKVLLVSPEDKVILVKGKSIEMDYYFILELKDKNLVFTLNLEDENIVLKKAISDEEISKYLNNEMTITITRNETQSVPTYKMYRNNELIAKVNGSSNNFPRVTGYNLSNYLGVEPDYGKLESQSVFDILSFEGELDSNDIYYINNVLDTNF